MSNRQSLFSEYRVVKLETGEHVIMRIYFNSKMKVVGYSDVVYPVGKHPFTLKIQLSAMLKATRKETLDFGDFCGPKKSKKKEKAI